MASYWSYLKRRFQHTFRYGREAVDIPSTIVGVILPALQSFYPHYWLSIGGQSMMNTLLWQVPVGALATLLTARFLAAPYQMHKEDALNALSERFAFERQSAEMQEKLALLERPLVVEIMEPIERGIIGIKVSNNSDKERRVVSVRLSLLDIANDTAFVTQYAMHKSKRISAFPHAMPANSSFELMFCRSLNGFLQWGVKSFYAVVELEVGPKVQSAIKDISSLVPTNCHVARRLQQSVDREVRIAGFVARYIQEGNASPLPFMDGEFQTALKAGITTLQTNSEVTEALQRVSVEENSHTFKGDH